MRHLLNIHDTLKATLLAWLGAGMTLSLASCADDELPAGPQTLEDSVAMQLRYKGVIAGMDGATRTAAGDFGGWGTGESGAFKYVTWNNQAKTRCTVDSISNWKNMISRELTMIINSEMRNNYHVEADGTIYADMGPFIFATTPVVTAAKAWYPGTEKDTIKKFAVQKDQSIFGHLEHSDLMYGVQAVPSNTINFKHKMAQVEIHLTVLRYYEDRDTIDTIDSPVNSVKIAGVAMSGDIDIDNFQYPGGIVPNHLDNDTVTCFHYTDSDKYDPTPNGFGDTVFCYKGIIFPQDTTFVIVLDIDDHIYKGRVEKYVYDDGVLYNIYGNLVEQVEFRIGDYLCVNNDGDIGFATAKSLDSMYNEGYLPIGLIFSDKTSREDQENGWKRGYAMALTDVRNGGSGSVFHLWSRNRSSSVQEYQYGSDYKRAIKNVNGYQLTHHIVDNTAYDSINYPAFFAATKFRTAKMPRMGMTSDWYLPSVGQWYWIIKNLGKPTSLSVYEYYWYDRLLGQRPTVRDNINGRLAVVAPYADYDNVWVADGSNSYLYWTSTEADYWRGVFVGGDSNSDDSWDNDLCIYSWEPMNKHSSLRVRPVIAF